MATRAKKIVDLSRQYRFDFEAPLVQASVPACIPEKYSTGIGKIDLNNFLAPVPENIFLVRVTGESMIDGNINDGDILVVDKNEGPADGKIVIASLNGELTVKTYRLINGQVFLYSANRKFLPIKIEDYIEFNIQGVVKHVIHIM